MSSLGDDPAIEADEADLVEQDQPVPDGGLESVPAEADEGDALEQSRAVPGGSGAGAPDRATGD
jgi:hypothetical protein